MSSFCASSAVSGQQLTGNVLPPFPIWEDVEGSNQDKCLAELSEGHVDGPPEDHAWLQDHTDKNPSAGQSGGITRNLQLDAGNTSSLSQTNTLNNDEKKQRLTRVPLQEIPGNAQEAFEVKNTFLELKSIPSGHKRMQSDSKLRYGDPGDGLETQAVDSVSPQPSAAANANGAVVQRMSGQSQPTAGSWQGAQGQSQPTRINLNDHLPHQPVSQQALPTMPVNLPPFPIIPSAHIDFLRSQLALAEHVHNMQRSQLALTPEQSTMMQMFFFHQAGTGHWRNPG